MLAIKRCYANLPVLCRAGSYTVGCSAKALKRLWWLLVSVEGFLGFHLKEHVLKILLLLRTHFLGCCVRWPRLLVLW